MNGTSKQVFSIREVCEHVGLGRSKIYAEIAAGRLRARKCGARTLILRPDLENWLGRLPELQ